MKLKTTTLLIMALAMAVPLLAQVPQNPTYGLTPNARSIQRYGDIPVSLYTGTPNISIPLATLCEGELTLPIALSYHSGGIKVDEHPGWVGLGWTLVAGGCITREVRDKPDETREWGYMYKHNLLDLRNQNSITLNRMFSTNIETCGYYETVDTEPDKFNFNFPGYSGYFMMDTDGEWAVCCDRPIKVESSNPVTPRIIFPNGSSTYTTAEDIFPQFIITAEDGVKYTFGNKAVELSITSSNQLVDEWAVSAWHLTEIEHPNGDKINFTYDRGDFVVNFSNSSTNITIPGSTYGTPGGIGGQLISPIYLKKITSEFTEVIFESSESVELNYKGLDYANRDTDINSSINLTSRRPYCPYDGNHSMMEEIKWRQLDKVSFRHKNSGNYKNVRFNYSASKNQRLTLLGLEITGFGENLSEKYKFSYQYIGQLPPYLSSETDHWGFYNGQNTTIYDPDYKKTNPLLTTYGTLKEITYPTGGKTVYEFESNSYTKILHENIPIEESGYAGGVRIKQIINVPNDGSDPEIRTFGYVNHFIPEKKLSECIGSGILEGKPVYHVSVPYILNGSAIDIREESNSSLTTIINNYGFHISYPSVYEIQEDGGHTLHTFIPPTYAGYRDEAPLVASNSQSYVPHSLKGHYRGKPLKICQYNNDGKCLMEESFSYDIIGQTERWAPSLNISYTEIPDMSNSHSPSIFYLKYSLYKNYIHSIAEASRIITIYGNSADESQITYNYKKYNDFGQLKSDSTITKLKNLNHTAVANYMYQWESDQWYESRHIKNLVSNIENKIDGKTVNHLSNSYSFYGSSFPVLTKVSNLFDGSCDKLLYECNRFDRKGKPIQVTNEDGLKIVYLWGSDRMFPVAEIKNADVFQVGNALGYSPENAPEDSNIQQTLKNLRVQLPQSYVTTYTYIPFLGITSITDPAGKTTYYGYDAQARLTNIWDSSSNLIKKYFYETFSGPSIESNLNPILPTK